MKHMRVVQRKKSGTAIFIAALLLVSLNAYATTTVTVEENANSTAAQTVNSAQASASRQAVVGDFEGRVSQINASQNWIMVQDVNNNERQVGVKPENINNFRIGDAVLIHATETVTLVTLQENPKDFEGGIIRVDSPKGQIVVLDTNGCERKVQLKQGMISGYDVGDYVRIHLMADLKEAKTIETVRDVVTVEGGIVSVDPTRSQIVVRGNDSKDSAVLIRQGQIQNYAVGDRVQMYLLPNHEQVQVIRVIR